MGQLADRGRWRKNIRHVTPYFDAMRARVVDGRRSMPGPHWHADGGGGQSIIRNRFWPGQHPVGQRVRRVGSAGNGPWMTVVGVVGDVMDNGLGADLGPTLLVPYLQQNTPTARISLTIRTKSDPLAVANTVRQAVWSIDPIQPIDGVRALEDALGESVAQPRFRTVLMGIFGSFGLLLACIGVQCCRVRRGARRRSACAWRLARPPGSDARPPSGFDAADPGWIDGARSDRIAHAVDDVRLVQPGATGASRDHRSRPPPVRDRRYVLAGRARRSRVSERGDQDRLVDCDGVASVAAPFLRVFPPPGCDRVWRAHRTRRIHATRSGRRAGLGESRRLSGWPGVGPTRARSPGRSTRHVSRLRPRRCPRRHDRCDLFCAAILSHGVGPLVRVRGLRRAAVDAGTLLRHWRRRDRHHCPLNTEADRIDAAPRSAVMADLRDHGRDDGMDRPRDRLVVPVGRRGIGGAGRSAKQPGRWSHLARGGS